MAAGNDECRIHECGCLGGYVGSNADNYRANGYAERSDFDVTIDFGENVRDFTRSDVDVTNANKANSWESQTESRYVLHTYPDDCRWKYRQGDDRCA